LLREYICDLNRKLRRRMVSKGAVTLDAEDEFGPHEWPKVSDVSRDLLSYSVHFPLEPMVSDMFYLSSIWLLVCLHGLLRRS